MNDFIKKIFKYSICYLIITIAIIILFKVNNKSFIWINVSYDGLDQHFVNLHLLKNFLNGNFCTFFWNIGYGIDMFSNFAYYIFGDFPSFISIFFPYDKLDLAYEIIILLRIYLIGISFILYTKEKKYNNNLVVIGSLLYTFSSFSLFAMARHPYFLNSLIIFPIFLLSIEKFILDDNKIFFIFMVAILFISSFYFGYMLSIIIMIYGIIFAYKHYNDKKKVIKKAITALLYAIVGIMIAGVILLPTFEAFLNSPRTGGKLYFYPLYYYPKLIASLISTENTGNWSLIGISSIILVTFPMFIKDKKRDNILLIFLAILFVPLLIPFIATIFDCMSFPNNRWAFVIPFIFSLITIEVLNKKIEFDMKKSCMIIIVYILIIFLLRMKINIGEFFTIIFSFIFVFLISKKRNFILPLIIINIISNFYFMYSKNFDNYIKEFADSDALSLLKNNNNNVPYLDSAIEFIKKRDDGFYNILVYPNVLNNLGIINNYNSTSYFYSIVSKNYYELAKELNNQEMTMNAEIKNFNLRTRINSLLNNKYLVTTNKDFHPYGYEIIKNFDSETYVLENKISPSFAHLYTESISENDYDNLLPLEKEDALIKYNISNKTSNLDILNIRNTLYTSNKNLDKKLINQKNKSDKLILNFDSIENSEIYLSINNLKRKNNPLLDSIGDNDYKIEACINDVCLSEWEDGKYTTAYNIENSNILINFGYYENIKGNIEILFRDNGEYTFDDIEILQVDFNDYENTMSKLNVPIVNFNMNNEKISFDTYIKNDGVLSFTTNYSKYFEVYIDNVKVNSKEVNKYFLGCDIEKGNHHIEIIYHNTMIFKGMCISLLGILIFSVIIFIDLKKGVKKYEKN